jgi:hypothetical protein
MKQNTLLNCISVIFTLLICFSCTKKTETTPEPVSPLPTVQTIAATNVSADSVVSGITISATGTTAITESGLCISTSANPSISDFFSKSKLVNKGTETLKFFNLQANTTYYLRAYAKNNAGIAYGNQVEFTTSAASLPVISTSIITGINQTSALGGGTISSRGGASISRAGVCWSTNPNPTPNDSNTFNALGLGRFVSYISGLKGNTKYYIRAYATNSAGTGYGNEIVITTLNATVYEIGKSYGGGIIFYVDGTGQHGLISAQYDQAVSSADWGCEGTYCGATGTGVGTGSFNTNQIVKYCNNPNSAAMKCYNLVLNGYSDWFLPSKDELNLMHSNLYLNDIGDFDLSTYWSSSEYNKQFAWKQFFNMNLNQSYYDKELVPYNVRAARAF